MVFLYAFLLSSSAGLAALLRSPAEISRRSVVSAALNSGLLGLAVSLVWYIKYQDNLFALVGICLVVGLGGNTMVDFAISVLKQGGLIGKILEGKKDAEAR